MPEFANSLNPKQSHILGPFLSSCHGLIPASN